MAVSPHPELLITARFLDGIGVGIASMRQGWFEVGNLLREVLYIKKKNNAHKLHLFSRMKTSNIFNVYYLTLYFKRKTTKFKDEFYLTWKEWCNQFCKN
jgi:hypothetical protein